MTMDALIATSANWSWSVLPLLLFDIYYFSTTVYHDWDLFSTQHKILFI